VNSDIDEVDENSDLTESGQKNKSPKFQAKKKLSKKKREEDEESFVPSTGSKLKSKGILKTGKNIIEIEETNPNEESLLQS
jgi:hypothetical protein